MPFVCVQTAPRSGKPADRPRKADSQGAAGRKLQAEYSPASGTSVHLEGMPWKRGIHAHPRERKLDQKLVKPPKPMNLAPDLPGSLLGAAEQALRKCLVT